jgi:hypothetical protein
VARLQDIAPTLESLLGLPLDQRLPSDGADLSRGWTGADTGPGIALAESGSALHARLTDYLVTGRKQRLHCINGPRFSLCRTGKNKETLHDRQSDPLLKSNIMAKNRARADVLREAWKRWPVERTRQRVARTSRFSLVARPLLEGGYGHALYDHRQDQAMVHDLSAEHPAVAQRLQAVLESWSAEVDGTTERVTERSAQTEAAMRALGYLE